MSLLSIRGLAVFDLISVAFISLINVVGMGLCFWVFLSNKKLKMNIIFISMLLFLLISLDTMYIAERFGLLFEHRLILTKISYVFAAAATLETYYFVKYFPVKKFEIRYVDYFITLLSAIIAYLCLFTDLIVSTIKLSNNSLDVMMGNLGPVYYLSYTLFASAVLYVLVRKYFFSNINRLDKKKINFLLFGLIVFICFSIVFNVIFPVFMDNDRYYYFADYSIIFFFIFAAYAILKNGLFDVRLAVVRSVSYSFVIVSLAAIYFGITSVFSFLYDGGSTSFGQTFVGVIASLIMAFAFQPIRRFFDKISNKIFYKYNYNSEEFFARLNKVLAITTDLRELLERVSNEIENTLKADQVFFFINTAQGHYVTAGTKKHASLPKKDAEVLGEYKVDKNELIVSALLNSNDPIHRMMVSHKVEIILKLTHSNEVIGFLCLGYHKTSGYTFRDMKVLSTIADELIIAIQNALSVQEVKDLNENLQQRISSATKELRASNAQLQRLDKAKNEFVSMASHQLRTPLTSIKGYVSMILDGDVGPINDQMRHMLEEAFMSSERMVHLINDFLNMSRIQTGKFVIEKTPVDFAKVVKQEIDSLQPSAVARGLKFVYNQPEEFPLINVDEGKMRQVIMNFSDNAIFYSKPNTIINIILESTKDEIIFKVIDQGIGVPDHEKSQLFTKFFRATNARTKRPDGTGVGLYLAKRVIDAHKGDIIFDSIEGKGSTFGFRVPIEQK